MTKNAPNAAESLLLGSMNINRDFIRSFKSTSKKDKYYKLLDQLHETLTIVDDPEKCFFMYMSVPRILKQGQKTIDLRLDTPTFKTLWNAWMASYPNDIDFEEGSLVLKVPESSPSALPGISRKQIKHVIRHRNKLTTDQVKDIRASIKGMDQNNPLITQLQSAFKE